MEFPKPGLYVQYTGGNYRIHRARGMIVEVDSRCRSGFLLVCVDFSMLRIGSNTKMRQWVKSEDLVLVSRKVVRPPYPRWIDVDFAKLEDAVLNIYEDKKSYQQAKAELLTIMYGGQIKV